MQIFVTKDYQEMSEAAADMIVDLVEEKPGCVLGLATGSTPEGLYAEIAKRHEAEDIDFSQRCNVQPRRIPRPACRP